MYIIGKTGMGKTVLLENMTIQDIQSGEGVGIIDPHGEYAERMLDFVPPSRINDVVYFNPCDLNNPIAFNVMEDVGPERRHLVSTGLIGVFKKIWPDVWSARMEYLLSNSILALLETPGTTLLGINRILADKEYRKQIVGNTTDPIVRAFWENEYAKYTEKFAAEAGAAVQNKIGQFTSNPLIRNIVGQAKSSMDMRKIMDEKKILVMNLSKGRIGEENAKLLGALLVTRLYLAAMTRIEVEESKRNDFYLYVDEFQNFATESFASILSEARKYRLDLILAHQYVEQMTEEVRDAVFGNVGTMISFRIGATDAELFEKEFSPEFLAKDLVNLGFTNIYLRLMIDGVASRPFSASTLPPMKFQDRSYRDEIILASQKTYGRDRKIIDKEIIDWQGLTRSMGSVSGSGAPKRDEARGQATFQGSRYVSGKNIVEVSPSESKQAPFSSQDFVSQKNRNFAGLEKVGGDIQHEQRKEITTFPISRDLIKKNPPHRDATIAPVLRGEHIQGSVWQESRKDALYRDTTFQRPSGSEEVLRPAGPNVRPSEERGSAEISRPNVRLRSENDEILSSAEQIYQTRVPKNKETFSREVPQYSRDPAPQKDAVPEIRLYESRKDEFMRPALDIRSPRVHSVTNENSGHAQTNSGDTHAAIRHAKSSESSSLGVQPIRQQEKKHFFQPDIKKPSEFISLSQLRIKNSSAHDHISAEERVQVGGSIEQAQAKKKTINFIELKKILSESFAPKKQNQGSEEERGIVRDRTGMLKPRESPPAGIGGQKKTELQAPQDNKRVLKPGDRIEFK
mgnify:FL=1